MEDDRIIELLNKEALESKIDAFNAGFRMGIEEGKKYYERNEK